MAEALKEAKKAYKIGETPIGAVIVKDGVIISRGYNQKETRVDPTLHAEISAIKKACRKLETWRLNGCDMYVTLEPCVMCAGAIIHARLNRLFIGTMDPKAGAAGSVFDIFRENRLNHRVEVTYGILADECSELLKNFFRELRQKNR